MDNNNLFFMALDILEGQKTNPEKISPVEIKPIGPETGLTAEKLPLESGDIVESGRMASGSERVYKTDLPPATSAYPADPALQAYKKIETILEADLGEMYNNLTPKEQKAFKVKGEETTQSIFQLVYHKSKIKVKKIIKLIRNWLKFLPGINKFFLEQEAKIKADKIVALADQDKKIQF